MTSSLHCLKVIDRELGADFDRLPVFFQLLGNIPRVDPQVADNTKSHARDVS